MENQNPIVDLPEEEFAPLPPAREEGTPILDAGEDKIIRFPRAATEPTDTETSEEQTAAKIAEEEETAPNEENLLARFTPTFQRDVLALLIHNQAFLKRNAPYLKTEFFSNKVHRTLAKIVLDLHHLYPEEPIGWNAILNEYKKRRPSLGIKAEDDHLYLEVLSKLMAPPSNPTYIEREVQEFTSTKALEIAEELRAAAEAAREMGHRPAPKAPPRKKR